MAALTLPPASFYVLKAPVDCRNSNVGGGRGMFARKAIYPGTIVLSETPLIQFGDEHQSRETGHIFVVRKVLQSEEREVILDRLRILHPSSLADLPVATLELARRRYQMTVNSLVHGLRPMIVDAEDVLLLFLKVQLNALETGLFTIIALVNHSCFPNCSVLSSLQKGTDGNEQCIHADVVATRMINVDEEITFCFHGCLERSSQARAELFRSQHLCELAATVTPFPEQLDGFKLAVDNSIAANLLARVEQRLDSLEATHQRSVLESRGALAELSVLEEELSMVVHPKHLVLCRVGRLTLSAARNVLTVVVPDSELAHRLVRVALQVRASQALYLPITHLQAAQAADDLALALNMSLTYDRERLFRTFPDQFPDFTSASLAEATLLKEAQETRRLYDAVDLGADRTSANAETLSSRQSWHEYEAMELGTTNVEETAPQQLLKHEDWSIFD